MKPRILMVGPYPPPFGGLGNNMSLLLNSDLSRRYDLDLLRTSKHVKHVKVSQADAWSGPYLVWNSLRMIDRLIRRRPRLVYVKATSDTGFVRDAALMALARMFGLKVVCHLHGRPMGRLFAETGFWPRQVARAMRMASVTVVLSPGLKTIFSRMFPGQPIEVLPNVVDISKIAPPPARNGSGPVRILFVGRLSRDKGAFDILEIAGRLMATDPDFRIDLVGIAETEAEEKEIRRRTAELGLADHLVFHGYRSGAEKATLFANADIFLLPTYAEIFPNVVLEAMAAGLPVVTTDVPVIPEMVTENVHGHLRKPGDIDGFVEALRLLVRDPERRRAMGAHNRTEAETRYDVPVAVTTLSTIFDRVMS
ncbi:MAG TPA: glycosyltransferase family 4 protein [Candidatus Eisenbacteria bacterium]